MYINRFILFLALILIFFLFTRLFKITEIPPSLYWDEASIGYNAYSLLKTGSDEWGEFLPLHFRAFGEFKLPVYIYAVVFFESIFGLNELAVRLPAVFFSLGAVILTYLLATKISGSKLLGLYSALILSTTPWFFIFSRTGYEATAGLFLYLLGSYLFFLGIQKNWLLVLSFLSFILTLYSYNSFRIITPLTLIFLIIFLVKNWRFNMKKLVIMLFICLGMFAVCSIPILRLIINDNGAARLSAVGIFSQAQTKQQLVTDFTLNYIAHFNPDFLLLNGDLNLRSGMPRYGVIYWIQLPLILLGIFYIVWKRKLINYFVLFVILISPIPAAITIESPHSLRSISAIPFVAILCAYGIALILEWVKNAKWMHVVFVAAFIAYFSVYFYNFINFYPQTSSSWQHEYKKIFLEYGNTFGDYDSVLISDKLAQPYIFSLFYLKTDPKEFVTKKELNPINEWGFSAVSKYGNLIFDNINMQTIPEGKSLIFAYKDERINNLVEKGTINNTEGESLFYVYEYEKN